MADKTPSVYYFGAWNGPGHYLWTPDHARVRDLMFRMAPPVTLLAIPWPICEIDGELAPGGTDAPRIRQVEGVARLYHLDGWTALAFWDRSGDIRPGSNSVFLIDAVLDFGAAEQAARRAFPSVFGRFSFELRPEGGK